MILTFEQRHAPGGRLCPAFSSSKASSSSTTNNTDMRVVGGDNSTNLSAQNSTVSVIATDHGAVEAGMVLGTQALNAVAAANEVDAAANADMFKGALAAVSNSSDKLALAYQSGQAGDQTALKYVGFIVVGLAAVTLFGKK
ncbi:hypothetical protein HUU62_04360 [Rhodoferax sp. 4810]|nr:hypothetical protein [Rhodoferax jenense]